MVSRDAARVPADAERYAAQLIGGGIAVRQAVGYRYPFLVLFI